jgi:hypothetical protein
MPSDNSTPITAGSNVNFPQSGPTSGSIITRINSSSFKLSAIGTYQVFFQISVDTAGQLMLNLNGVDLLYTVVGQVEQSNKTASLVGMFFINTTVVDSTLVVKNPTGNSSLTITQNAGGNKAVSAHLIITKIG